MLPTTPRSSNLAKQLFGTLYVCLFGDGQAVPGACPESNGGVCDQSAGNYNPNNCDACLQKAQMQGGACYMKLLQCLADCNIDEDCAQLTCGGKPCSCQSGVCG